MLDPFQWGIQVISNHQKTKQVAKKTGDWVYNQIPLTFRPWDASNINEYLDRTSDLIKDVTIKEAIGPEIGAVVSISHELDKLTGIEEQGTGIMTKPNVREGGIQHDFSNYDFSKQEWRTPPAEEDTSNENDVTSEPSFEPRTAAVM